MKLIRTWVLISDGACARILCHAGQGRALKAVPGLSFPYESPRTLRSEVRLGSATLAEDTERFTTTVAHALDDHLTRAAFDRLVIIAPANVRDLLRASMSDRVRRHVSHELVLNLTRMPNKKVAGYLQGVLAA